MKIDVQQNGHHIFIPVPSGLIFNSLTASIAGSIIKKHTDVPLTSEEFEKVFDALRQAKRSFGHLVLVDVESSKGEKVKITL